MERSKKKRGSTKKKVPWVSATAKMQLKQTNRNLCWRENKENVLAVTHAEERRGEGSKRLAKKKKKATRKGILSPRYAFSAE
jgi:hypothetical protein